MADMIVSELETEAEWLEAFSVLGQLRTNLDEVTYLTRLRAMHERGYTLFALREDDDIVALAGVAIQTSLNDGRYAWIYDLVTDEENRSRGFGSQLLAYVERWAAERDCNVLALASGLQREDAHSFYRDFGMKATSYVFKRKLD